MMMGGGGGSWEGGQAGTQKPVGQGLGCDGQGHQRKQQHQAGTRRAQAAQGRAGRTLRRGACRSAARSPHLSLPFPQLALEAGPQVPLQPPQAGPHGGVPVRVQEARGAVQEAQQRLGAAAHVLPQDLRQGTQGRRLRGVVAGRGRA
jgi:hypothetical protein